MKKTKEIIIAPHALSMLQRIARSIARTEGKKGINSYSAAICRKFKRIAEFAEENYFLDEEHFPGVRQLTFLSRTRILYYSTETGFYILAIVDERSAWDE